MQRPSSRPLVIGHRGASAVAPENTVSAFRTAAEAGADGIELDVRTTSDDTLVVHHDARVPGFGPIWQHPFERLREAKPEVPTLDEAFDACGTMLVNIEIKNHPSERGFDPSQSVAELVATWITSRDVADRIIVSSFTRDTVGTFKSAAPAVATGQLVARGATLEDWIEIAAGDEHQWILPHRRYLKRGPEAIERAHAAGLAIGVWTVDGENWLRRFADDGVDAVITNDPARALALYTG